MYNRSGTNRGSPPSPPLERGEKKNGAFAISPRPSPFSRPPASQIVSTSATVPRMGLGSHTVQRGQFVTGPGKKRPIKRNSAWTGRIRCVPTTLSIFFFFSLCLSLRRREMVFSPLVETLPPALIYGAAFRQVRESWPAVYNPWRANYTVTPR